MRKSDCSRWAAPTTPRSATSPKGSQTGTKAPRHPCPSPARGSTPSTSTWPRSCPATAGEVAW